MKAYVVKQSCAMIDQDCSYLFNWISGMTPLLLGIKQIQKGPFYKPQKRENQGLKIDFCMCCVH